MLKYVDVSADPSAPERARLPSRTVSDALALGFDHLGWVAAVFEGGRTSPLINGIYVHRDGRMNLEITSTPFDSATLRTLFEDGTVVLTETMPPKDTWEMARRGIFPRKEHRIDLAVVEIASFADLLKAHEERLRAYEARGLRVWPKHDLRACFAMKQRWREVSDPRMKRQLKIALWIGGLVAVAVMIGAVVASRAFAHYSGVIMLLVLAGPPIGFAVFKWAFIVLAPALAKSAAAPPPRPASELLALADQVRSGFVPASAR